MVKLQSFALALVLMLSISSCVEEIEYFDSIEIMQVQKLQAGEFTDIIFADASTGYASTLVSTSNSFSEIFKTTDAGVTWTKIMTFPDLKINHMIFTNSSTGYIMGGPNGAEYYVYKTADGGHTWTKIMTSTSKLNNIDFADENNGFIVTDYKLLVTNNAGASWNNRQLPIQYSFNELLFFSEDKGLIFDFDDRKIFYTVNGGYNWKEKSIWAHPFDIKKINSTEALISGGSEILMITQSGENITTTRNSYSGMALFPFNSQKWVSAGEHTLTITTDGGTQYKELFDQAGASIALRKLWFINETTGFGTYEGKLFSIKISNL